MFSNRKKGLYAPDGENNDTNCHILVKKLKFKYKERFLYVVKCCVHYANKFGKLSSGHRLEKVSFHSNPKED